MVMTNTLFRPEWSVFWRDAAVFYRSLDVKGRHVIDVGSDFGTTPMFFLRQGAKDVIGYSLDKQMFHHKAYRHIQGQSTGRQIMDQCDPAGAALKMDAEGLEWQFDADWISRCHDWVIALHIPVESPELHDWIKENGILIGDQGPTEFAIYEKCNMASHK